MTNSNGRNIAIVTGSALGLGYELTKQLIADGWFVAGIDTAFYRDSRDYVSEEKQHTFMDPGELAQVGSARKVAHFGSWPSMER